MKTECKHENTRYCWRTFVNRETYFGTQCLRCGEWRVIPDKEMRELPTSVLDATAYDPDIRYFWFKIDNENL